MIMYFALHFLLISFFSYSPGVLYAQYTDVASVCKASTPSSNSSVRDQIEEYDEDQDFDLDELEDECSKLTQYTIWQRALFMYTFLKSTSIQKSIQLYDIVARNFVILINSLSSAVNIYRTDKNCRLQASPDKKAVVTPVDHAQEK